MPFKKISSVEILGFFSKESKRKTANNKIYSYYIDNDVSINLEEKLDAVADFYKISRDPSNYLLIPARANSVGRFNSNLDGWTFKEISNFRPELGCRTYSTYNNKPHFVEHNSSKFEVARGVILDSHLNLDNDADDFTKEAVLQTIGHEPTKDVFVEVILAVDQSKDPKLAQAYKSGSIKTFSMGADVESTTCNICGNVARSSWDFCPHIIGKHKRSVYKMADGLDRLAGELCNGTIFQELSVVSDPADKTAIIQDNILEIFSKAASENKLSTSDLSEIASFYIKHAKEFPVSLAKMVNNFLKEEANENRKN
jgi:hypothetical protein